MPPTPKRSTERRRRNKTNEETVEVVGKVPVPVCPEHIHQVARDWYEGLKHSGQAAYFEPSDWAAALYVCEAITKNMEGGRFSGQLFANVWAAMNDLLTTEGSRRRVRLEIERNDGKADDGKPTKLDEYKKRMASS